MSKETYKLFKETLEDINKKNLDEIIKEADIILCNVCGKNITDDTEIKLYLTDFIYPRKAIQCNKCKSVIQIKENNNGHN